MLRALGNNFQDAQVTADAAASHEGNELSARRSKAALGDPNENPGGVPGGGHGLTNTFPH